jgi:hypothetical protein
LVYPHLFQKLTTDRGRKRIQVWNFEATAESIRRRHFQECSDPMSKDLMRRIEKLERQRGVSEFETKLRRLVRRLGGNEPTEQAYLRAVRGHERELGPALGEDGTITWPGFLLLRQLLPSPASPEKSGEPRPQPRRKR